jgi:hypothetical protein
MTTDTTVLDGLDFVGATNHEGGMAAMLTGIPEDRLGAETVRSLGSVQMALMSGVLTQWLTDPATAPSPEQIVAGIRALGGPGLGQHVAGVEE